jgi:hypothetical protein
MPRSPTAQSPSYGSRPGSCRSSRERRPSQLDDMLREDRFKLKNAILGYQGDHHGKVTDVKVGEQTIHRGYISAPDTSTRESGPIFTETDPLPRRGVEATTLVSPESAKHARLYPISGYTGAYRGKVNGNLGRSDRHLTSLAKFGTLM